MKTLSFPALPALHTWFPLRHLAQEKRAHPCAVFWLHALAACVVAGLAAWQMLDLNAPRLPMALHAYRWLYIQVLLPAALGACAALYGAARWLRGRGTPVQRTLRIWCFWPAWCALFLALASGATLWAQHRAANSIMARAADAAPAQWQARSLAASLRELRHTRRAPHALMRWSGSCYHWSYRVMLFQMHDCATPGFAQAW